MRTWETGIEFGRALEQIRHHEARIAGNEIDIREIRHDLGSLRTYTMRGALLLALWIAAVSTNLPAERIGEIAGTTLKSLIR